MKNQILIAVTSFFLSIATINAASLTGANPPDCCKAKKECCKEQKPCCKQEAAAVSDSTKACCKANTKGEKKACCKKEAAEGEKAGKADKKSCCKKK